jgi:adenylyltransferase/sulfurtransferase
VSNARVLIVGMGGLGCPASTYLAAAGIGTLVIADFDHIEASNLQRQILYRVSDIGEEKVTVAATRLRELNPDVDVETIGWAMDQEALLVQVESADCVLDCSDNFETRFAVNAACVESKTPLVSASAVGFEGQLSAFDLNRAESPCYECLFDPGDFIADPGEPCDLVGVYAPMLGALASAQAGEALKLIGGFGSPIVGRLLRLDGLDFTWRSAKVRPDPACACCGAHRRAN